ncbi:acyl-CoA synthetase [Nitratireductor aestuarii]|uniref:3-methylmercaptopropionyl-CoA ligase n=1 Tax=Nitratireductor aestuarii TaxID=1735103 RepID=A0A916S070_9HYPH|nr:long-chain-fatty-acid--CoA ligase [Nitratireductor aestuarii]GGA78869.1 acyl-CoA synthetase [Nitratireductor aestuarii]
MSMLMTVGDILRLNAKSIPDKLALVTANERITYAEINRRTNVVANALLRGGVSEGDRVCVLGYNSVDYFCLYFATAKIGAMMVPMNFWHRAEEHAYTLQDAEPSLLLYQRDFDAVLTEACEGTAIRRMEIPKLGEPAGQEWTDYLAGASDEEPDFQVDRQSGHIIIYTSGTTGRPKGALISQERTVLDAFAMSGGLSLRRSDVFLNYFPPFHIGNWDHQKLFLLVGATIVLQAQFSAEEALRTIEQEKVTVILSVPTMLHTLISHEDFDKRDVSSIRLLYYGAYDPSGILDRAAEKFKAREGKCSFAHTYGLTEAGCFAALCRPEEVFDHWGSVGRALPGVELELQDEDGNPVPDGVAGEICLKGPRMLGYWRNPEATAVAFKGGWLHTGDIAVRDKQGFLFLVDRKKDMIRSGGQNVYSKEVEDCISSHPAVADVGVIGLDDPVYEELVCAVVVLRPDQQPSEALAEDISAYVRTRKAGYNVPKRVEFIDALPKNAVGKIQKHVLREIYGAGKRWQATAALK